MTASRGGVNLRQELREHVRIAGRRAVFGIARVQMQDRGARVGRIDRLPGDIGRRVRQCGRECGRVDRAGDRASDDDSCSVDFAIVRLPCVRSLASRRFEVLEYALAQRGLSPRASSSEIPRRLFMPSLPAATRSLEIRRRARRRSRSASTVSWIARVRSVPTRSAFSNGPSTARRRPKLALTTVSTVLRIANAVCHERDRLAPQRVLQAVADEPRHVLLDRNRCLAAPPSEAPSFARLRLGRGRWRLDDFHQRHEVGRVPPMRAEGALGCASNRCMICGDGDHRGVARENRRRRCRGLDLGEDLLLQREVLRARPRTRRSRSATASREDRHTPSPARRLASCPRSLQVAREFAHAASRASPATDRRPAQDDRRCANTCAMPCPIRPRADDCNDSARGHGTSPRCSRRRRRGCARIKIRGARGEKQQRSREIFGLAQSAERDARQHAARVAFAFSSSSNIHAVNGERNTVGRDGVDRDPVLAPLASQRLGEAVGRGFRGAVGAVAGRVAQLAARRGNEHHLAAATLRDDPLAESPAQRATLP